MKAPLLVSACLAGLLAASCGKFAPSVTPPATPDEARARIEALSAALTNRPASRERLDEWENAQVYLRKARFILSAYDCSTNVPPELSLEILNAQLAIEATRPEHAVPLVPGNREEGYYADLDDSFQPYLRYLPRSYKKGQSLPLIVYLHGYNPDYTILNWQGFPEDLYDFAEREGVLLAEPFGRGNTDFQGIGERDVLAVIAEMTRRYGADPRRIILVGYSMGATGAWSLSARHPGLFAGSVMMAGRGDYYFWHGLDRRRVPAWKRTLIDDDFAGSRVASLRDLPIYCAHGAYDDMVPVDEGRFIARLIGAVNTNLIYREIPYGDHGIWPTVFNAPDFQAWLRARRRSEPGKPTPPAGRPLGIRGAFLSPFVFVQADERVASGYTPPFRQAVVDWCRYAKAVPRLQAETAVSSNILQACNVFLFGEPETSGLIRQVLARSPVRVTPAAFVVGGRAYPRAGNGLYLAQPSPWNPEKLAVIQCGIPWGEGMPENHKYDFLPDYIVYTAELDDDGSNSALGAGFFDASWRLAE